MRAVKKIALFSDDPDWHARRLTGALEARGAETVWLSFADCAFDLSGGGSGLYLPGFEDSLPDGAIVRLIASGSLEQITLRLGILHALHELGVPVYNSARAIERTVDKSMTTFLMRKAGLPTPPTWACESAEMAQAIVERETRDGGRLVLKPLFGAQGKGLCLIDARSELPDPEEGFGGVYYLQRFVDNGGSREGWHDWRILVVGGRAIAAMIRRGKGWITNVWQGATCEAAAVDGEPSVLAVAAANAVGANYAGVDIIRDPEGGFQLLEVNSVPAWKGLQEVTAIDIAEVIVGDFFSTLPSDAGYRAKAC